MELATARPHASITTGIDIAVLLGFTACGAIMIIPTSRPLFVLFALRHIILIDLQYSQRCASGCVAECRTCNREVAGSNLGRGYFAQMSTQPSIPPGSVNEYQPKLGRQRQVWLLPIADERVGVQVKLRNPLRTRAIPERFCGGDSRRRGAIPSVCTFIFTE